MAEDKDDKAKELAKKEAHKKANLEKAAKEKAAKERSKEPSRKEEQGPSEGVYPRLMTKYKEEIAPKLMNEFKFKSKMQVPELKKIVINAGLGSKATQNIKVVEQALPRGMVVLQPLIQPGLLEDHPVVNARHLPVAIVCSRQNFSMIRFGPPRERCQQIKANRSHIQLIQHAARRGRK